MRHVFTAAVLVSAALTLTACGPGGDKASGPDASASAAATGKGQDTNNGSSSPTPGEDGKVTPGNSGSPTDPGFAGEDQSEVHGTPMPCKPVPKGMKLIWVQNVEGVDANVVAQKAGKDCAKGGGFYRDGESKMYRFKMSSPVRVITDEQGHTELLENKPGTRTGIGHVKTCADPDGDTWDGGQAPKDSKEYCYGINYYEVRLDSEGVITEMNEVAN